MVARLSFLFSVKNMVSSANRASLVLWLVVKSVVGGRKESYGTPAKIGLVDEK